MIIRVSNLGYVSIVEGRVQLCQEPDLACLVQEANIGFIGKETRSFDLMMGIELVSHIGPPHEGWKLLLPEEKQERVERMIQNNYPSHTPIIPLDEETVDRISDELVPLPPDGIVVSILGGYRKGKTFLMEKLISSNFKEVEVNEYVKFSKGISVLVPEEQSRFIVLDATGKNSPITNDLRETVIAG